MEDDWDKYIKLFLDYLKAERNASPYTMRNYLISLGAFESFCKKDNTYTPKKVEKPLVRSFLNHLNETGIARSSIARNMSAIRSFFRYLQREEIVPKNPAANITSPKLDRRLPSFLTREEVKHIVESPGLPKQPNKMSYPVLLRDISLLELLYASGLRVSEVVSIDLEQMNLDYNEIRVKGKGSKERNVLIGEPAARTLRTYLKEARPVLAGDKKSRAVFITSYQDEDGIQSGERLTVRRVQKIIKKYSRDIGKRVHPHILRHTFATHLLDGGADLKVVQELLGHADLASTQIYTHVSQTRARQIYLAAHPMARGKGEE